MVSVYTFVGLVDGQDYIRFSDISSGFTGLVTGTDDGCSGVIYVNNGVPYGAATHNYVYVSFYLLKA